MPEQKKSQTDTIAGIEVPEKPTGNRRLTQEERSAISDQRMFNAAMNLIGVQGAYKTTLKDICEAAGYSRGLANYRFGSKDAFFGELIEHFNKAWAKALRSNVGDARGREAIHLALDAFEQFLFDHGTYMRGRYIIMFESLGGESPVRTTLKEVHKAYIRDMAGWVREGIEDGEISADEDPEDFAEFYCSIIFGTVFQWLVRPEDTDVAKMCASFRRKIDVILG